MFAGAVATTGAVFESKEPVVDRNALFLQLKRDIEELGSASPIDYHVLSEASKTRIEPFIGAVDAFAHQYNLAYGIDMKEGARLESTQAPAPSQQVLLHIRMGLWERMRGSFPDLPAYTDEQFYHTMVHLPERLAPLGVRTEAGVFASYTSDQNIYDITVAFGRFLPIKRIERLSRTYFGRAVEVPVLYFGSPLGKNTQGPSGQEMVTMFGAVGIFSNTGERQAGEWMHARKKIPEALKIYENQYGSPPLQEPFRGDYLIYSTLNDLVQKEDPPSKLELFDSVFAHEAGGHVVDDSDPAYKKALIPSDSELMDQKPEYILHALSHAEVDGLLSGLRYGEGNLGLYALLVNLLSDHEQTGPTHHYAARWIGDRLAPVILKNPMRLVFISRQCHPTVQRSRCC